MAAIPFLKRNVKSFARSRGLNLVRGFIVACVASCAGGDSTTPTPVIPPSIATTITASEGSQAIRTAGLVLSPSPTVTVLDQNGKIMSGVPITATVSGGGGSLSGSPELLRVPWTPSLGVLSELEVWHGYATAVQSGVQG